MLLVRIAHVQVRIVGADAFGIYPNFADEVRTGRLKERVLF